MNSQELKSFRRLVAWLCSIFWIFLALPFMWIKVMALALLSLTVRSAEETIGENLEMASVTS